MSTDFLEIIFDSGSARRIWLNRGVYPQSLDYDNMIDLKDEF
ncbi:hypothetical protein [uncultured Desulfobacter sp.]